MDAVQIRDDLRQEIDRMNEMILEGQALEAFEEFYHQDVAMQEGSREPVVGKDTNREREEEFFGKVTELRTMELRATAVGDGVTMCEWRFEYSHEDWGEQAYDQVAVQRWKDGKIIHERFFKEEIA